MLYSFSIIILLRIFSLINGNPVELIFSIIGVDNKNYIQNNIIKNNPKIFSQALGIVRNFSYIYRVIRDKDYEKRTRI